MTVLSMHTARPRAARAATGRATPARSQGSGHAAVPVWVHRLHADGLPVAEHAWRATLQTGSQRFIERWNRVACGY
jgi:hypothetical protein